MRISNYGYNIYPKYTPRVSFTHLAPLKCDIVCFGQSCTVAETKGITPEESYNHLYNLCLTSYKDYFSSPESAELYFSRNEEYIKSLSELCDKELNSILSDKGIGNFTESLNIIYGFKKNNVFDLLKDALRCTNPDGTKLRQNQKLQLVDILQAYKLIHTTPKEFKNMVNSGVVDIRLLQENILADVMKKIGCYTQDELSEIPKDKLNSWDTDYVYLLLSSHRKNPTGFEDVVILANNVESFKSQIAEADVNINTKKEFKKHGLDYQKWLSPSESNNVRLQLSGTNTKRLDEISESITDTIDMLRLFTPIRQIIDKKYKDFVQGNDFVLPEDIKFSKAELMKFLIRFDNDMKPVWKRAERNLATSKQAKFTKKCQEYMLENMKLLCNYNKNQALDLTVKMWDRIPQKDLFQGNYSTCCIAMGKANAGYMPSYLLNTVFNMIEITDNTSGKTIANALCYYLSDDKNKPIFVIDNIEMNNSFNKPSEEMVKKIRSGIVQYVQNLNREVAKDEIPVYIGEAHNDIPVDDLETKELDVKLLGCLDKYEETYADAFGGGVTRDWMSGKVNLKSLKS